ncbi:DUF6232 family protein [Streptomyces sp. NPDC056944]|uniref:DUF6232 family protein n=1 Tax=unclassified Streptomyces TaxID=2593676 RepID=UPI0036333D70
METPGTPPPQPPPRPPHPPAPERAPAPARPRTPPRQSLLISKRLLWVHGAAYPLENIVRVYTFDLTPRRGAAFARFLKRGGFTALVLVLIVWISDSSSGGWDGSSSDLPTVSGVLLLPVVFLLIYFIGDMLAVVFAATHHVLAVETNGRSTALVTAPREQLNELVVSIAEAIDKPDAELRAHVASLAITNYANYHFGDSVNMYGGSGNTGVAR